METPDERVVAQLLKAGADPTLENDDGERPLHCFEEKFPTHPATIALLEQSLDADKAWFFVKARHLVMDAFSTMVPSFLQDRVAEGLPLPHVALAATDGQNNDNEEEARRKLRTTLALMCGVGREAMPRDVFRVVLDLLMPVWDRMRRKGGGGGGQSRTE